MTKILLFLMTPGLAICILLASWQNQSSTMSAVPTPTGMPIPLQPTLLVGTGHDELNPQWSPDGSNLAFVGHHEGNPEVYVYSTAAKSVSNISLSAQDNYNPYWSPDGTMLVYFERLGGSLGWDRLKIATPANTTVAEVPLGYGGVAVLGWYPDSSGFLFVHDQILYRYDIKAHSLQTIYNSRNSGILQAFVAPNFHTMVIVDTYYSEGFSGKETLILDSQTGQITELPFGIAWYLLTQTKGTKDNSVAA
jgi:Tol biopolymer transport system component